MRQSNFPRIRKGASRLARAALFSLLLIAPGLHAEESPLSHSTSPYLRKHSASAIRWNAWGEEAWKRAHEEDKPIFLSIGYLTCHGCHIMAEETFSAPEVAALLNEEVIAILVDREERPDVDRLYQTYVAATTGRGGWPLNVWMTPDRQPFLGGTYYSRADFLAATRLAVQGWRKDREQVQHHAQTLLRAWKKLATQNEMQSVPLGRTQWSAAFAALEQDFDTEHGGFGREAKFPQPAKLHFLFRYSVAPGTEKADAQRALAIALQTLTAMVNGQLYDAKEGGFHRYTTDRAWQLPHYEKMLYDQAWITHCLLDAYQLTGDARWAEVAHKTLSFVEKRLLLPQGLFASSYNGVTAGNASGPLRDDKVISAWNGAMVSAFARASHVLGEPRYLDVATRSAREILSTLYDATSGQLLRISQGGKGFAEDYAAVIHGLLDLYEADFDALWLQQALVLQREMDARFRDAGRGYFATESGQAEMLLRLHDDFDGAEPAASSLAARNLRRLSAYTGEPQFYQESQKVLQAFAMQHQRTPAAMPFLLAESIAAAGAAQQIVIAGNPDAPDTAALLRVARSHFLPFSSLLLAQAKSAADSRPDYIASMEPIDGRAAAYICENFTCRLPLTEPEAFRQALLGKTTTLFPE